MEKNCFGTPRSALLFLEGRSRSGVEMDVRVTEPKKKKKECLSRQI